jgi:predicted CXXCH cytochrome family protein
MKKMSLLNSVLRRVGGGAAVALLAAGTLAVAPAQAGISTTKHNLGSNGTGVNKLQAQAGSTEICVFCHTPHGADTNASVPLWNKKLTPGAAYLTYNSLGTSSLDGNVLGVGSVSLACLSCHDGTQALNVMINAPGSDGYTAGGAVFGTMDGTNQVGNKLQSGAITNLDLDLKNDHPVGIQYAGGPKLANSIGAAGTDYTAFRDADFKTAKSTTANNMTVWWVDTDVGVAGTREKTDMQLYTRKGGLLSGDTTGQVEQPYVECASCHDPHSDNTTFLRILNTSSAVCLACHTK